MSEKPSLNPSDDELTSISLEDLALAVETSNWLKSAHYGNVLLLIVAPCLVGLVLVGAMALDGWGAAFSSGAGRPLDPFLHIFLPLVGLTVFTGVQLELSVARELRFLIGDPDPPSARRAVHIGNAFFLSILIVSLSLICCALTMSAIWLQESSDHPFMFSDVVRFLTMHPMFMGLAWGGIYFPASIGMGFVVDRGWSGFAGFWVAVKLIFSNLWLLIAWLVITASSVGAMLASCGLLMIPFAPWVGMIGIGVYFCCTRQQELLIRAMAATSASDKNIPTDDRSSGSGHSD